MGGMEGNVDYDHVDDPHAALPLILTRVSPEGFGCDDVRLRPNFTAYTAMQ